MIYLLIAEIGGNSMKYNKGNKYINFDYLKETFIRIKERVTNKSVNTDGNYNGNNISNSHINIRNSKKQ